MKSLEINGLKLGTDSTSLVRDACKGLLKIDLKGLTFLPYFQQIKIR